MPMHQRRPKRSLARVLAVGVAALFVLVYCPHSLPTGSAHAESEAAQADPETAEAKVGTTLSRALRWLSELGGQPSLGIALTAVLSPVSIAPIARAPVVTMDSRGSARTNPLSRLRGVAVGAKNKVLGKGVGRDDEAPAVLSSEVCLVPGAPVVRVESAPGNARRIFTGIDIVTDGADDDALEVVWRTLSDYDKLAEVVPNLVANEVLSRRERGARLKQLGGAKLAPGVTFTASTTLDVVEYLDGLPAEMEAEHLTEAVDETPGSIAAQSRPSMDSDAVRAFDAARELEWDVFPRPYCISELPHRDITMQGVRGEGDFRFYQGVWRLQALPGCAPPGSSAMRLTYSVELSPRAWVPVALLEGRIASALGENLKAVRDYVTAPAR